MYFKRFSLLNPESGERRSLSAFPSTLVGKYTGTSTFEVYLCNLNWDPVAVTEFKEQRAKDVTDAFCKQVLEHFGVVVHQGAHDIAVSR